eukprot:351879-Chlamydomonas_euryale.AAC.26
MECARSHPCRLSVGGCGLKATFLRVLATVTQPRYERLAIGMAFRDTCQRLRSASKEHPAQCLPCIPHDKSHVPKHVEAPLLHLEVHNDLDAGPIMRCQHLIAFLLQCDWHAALAE